MTDAKRRAQERIAAMVDAAADVVESDIKGTLVPTRGSTRVNSAWKALDVVLELPPLVEKPEDSERSIKSFGQLAELSEYIRLKKQDERRGA